MSNKIKSFKKKLMTFTVAGLITLTPMVANAELGQQVLVKGMKNNDVKELHMHLKDLNYLNIEEIGSYFNDETRQAVVDLQDKHGIEADGKFDAQSFKALKSEIDSKFGNELTSLCSKLMKEGSKGQDVKALQEGLKKLGFLNVDETNETYCKNVDKAVGDFQATYKLKVDGIAGKSTIESLSKVLTGEIKKEKPKTASRQKPLAKKPVKEEKPKASTGKKADKIVASAKTHLGKPYVYGQANGKAFDCSGYTQYVYKQNGVSIPRTASSQASAGKKVSRSKLKAGDLVIFSNTYKPGPSHAGIYIGDNQFIHASSGGKGVIVSSLGNSYYNRKFSYGRRVL